MDLCIIIPAYNAKQTIKKTLDSIKKQKLSIKYEVIIVNDCSDYDYNDFVNKYNKFYNIREITTRVNSGPGVARQLGIDNSNSKYIVFIDSDDSFLDENSILKLYNTIEKENADIVIGNFKYSIKNKFYVKEKDLTWLHGKIYKREFLEKNNIKFNNIKYNEDVGFNRLIMFLNPKYKFLNEVIYNYNENINSMTRKNNGMHLFEGIEGFCYNASWAMDEALKRNVSIDKISFFSLDVLCTLYNYYLKFESKFDVNKIFVWGYEINRKFLKYSKNKNYKQILSSDSVDQFEKFLDKFEK